MQYDDWQFLDSETVEQLDNYLMIYAAEPEEPQPYMSESEFPNDKLHEALIEIVAFIARVQRATIQNKDAVVTGEYVNVAALKEQQPIEEQITPGEPPSL
jgi:hypothetical protein